MNLKEAFRKVRISYDAVAPLGGMAVFGFWAGEAGMHAGAIGGFVGTLMGGELLREVVRLKQVGRWDLRRGSRDFSTEIELTDATRRRVL